jgi:hypothetical protein
MEFTGLNLLLILFAPIAVIFILMLLLNPLIRKAFHRHKPLEKQIQEKTRELDEQIQAKKKELIKNQQSPSKEDMELFKKEVNALWEEHNRYVSDAKKQNRKIHKEESGIKDVENEIVMDVKKYMLWFVGSMAFTPIALSFIVLLGLNKMLFQLFNISKHSEFSTTMYLIFLIFPAIGFWLSYKGYKDYKNRLSLILCLLINTLYAGGIIYGVFRLGISL